MDGGVCCPICFEEYTTSENHRATSLKCGHLFGHCCIVRWLSLSKASKCPACSAPCKKVHLRQIFAARVVARDQHDLDAVKQKKELEDKIADLEAQLGTMKSLLRCRLAAPVIHTILSTQYRTPFPSEDCLVEFDAVNQAVLVSCTVNEVHGLHKYCLRDFSISSFLRLPDRVRDIKVSPFSDGTCLVAFGSRISLMSIYTGDSVATVALDCRVSAVSFHMESRDHVLAGDEGGCLHMCNLMDGSSTRMKVCGASVHGIASLQQEVLVSSVLGVYSVAVSQSAMKSCSRVELPVSGVCTSIQSDGETALATFRDSSFDVVNVMMGSKFLVFTPGVKQKARHPDRILNGCVLVADDHRRSIKVLDCGTLQMVYSYPFKEDVVGFAGDLNALVVLTKRGVYCYSSRHQLDKLQ